MFPRIPFPLLSWVSVDQYRVPRAAHKCYLLPNLGCWATDPPVFARSLSSNSLSPGPDTSTVWQKVPVFLQQMGHWGQRWSESGYGFSSRVQVCPCCLLLFLQCFFPTASPSGLRQVSNPGRCTGSSLPEARSPAPVIVEDLISLTKA